MERSIKSIMFRYHEGAFFVDDEMRAKVRVSNVSPKPSFRVTNEEKVKQDLTNEVKKKTGKEIDFDQINIAKPDYVEYEIYPLFFYCIDCDRTLNFKDEDDLKKYLQKNRLICKRCGGELVQAGHVFVCSCGRVEQMKAPECKGCKSKMSLKRPTMHDVSTWNWKCEECGEEKNLLRFCPNCQKRMKLRSVESSILSIPLSYSALVYPEPKERWIPEYFGWENKVRENLQDKDLPKDEVELLYKTRLEKVTKKRLEKKFSSESEEVEELVRSYMAAKSKSTDERDDLNPKLGIRKIYCLDGVKIFNSVFGYARGTYKMDEVREKDGFHFFREDGQYKILANQLNTEGILFDLDRDKVISWLEENELAPEPEPTKREWIAKIAIEEGNRMGNRIYRLLHTLAHSLIKVAPIFGISSESLREKLFPQIPSVLIYNQSDENLGTIHTLFRARLEDWLNAARDDIRYCVHDPSCIREEEGAACSACVILNELSCGEFNEELDRRTLVGSEQETGFWNM